MRGNREAFERYAIVPRYLVDVSSRDQATSVLGQTYSHPFGISPMGLAGLFRPNADLMLAEIFGSAPRDQEARIKQTVEKAVQFTCRIQGEPATKLTSYGPSAPPGVSTTT